MISIKLNEPQPLDCPRCKEKFGYMYNDMFRMSYTSIHREDGKYEMGQYNDGKCLNRGVSAFCSNCGTRLPFKLNRFEGEEVEPSSLTEGPFNGR